MNKAFQTLDGALIVRRLLFFVLLFALSWVHLLVLFRGLGTEQAMDQAQIARQVARGEGLTTKNIRPLEHHLAETKEETTVPLVGLRDTYHSPLNPLVLGAVFKLVGADDFEAWEMNKKELVYPLDRVVALVSTLFFLMAIGVTYLLVSRIFDGKIAGVTALLMLLCDMFWKYSQSGLPQMLLLLLFSCGLYFTYRAVESQEEGRASMAQPLIAAAFFALMVLTHWITAWIFFGYLIFAAIAFRPRGIVALSSLAVLFIAVVYPLFRMTQITGQPFGVARFVFYNGLANGTESEIMRTLDLNANPLLIDGLLLKILGTTLVQATDLIPFLGGILAAPIFFIALLHPFKRDSIARFRWLIAAMWFFGAIGMAIFGISSDGLHPNQIHLLFAPIMAAYGLAFLSILWSRLEFVSSTPFLKNAHYIVIVALSAAPIILNLPKEVRMYIQVSDKGGWPQWPPYYPLILNKGMSKWVENDPLQSEIAISDQPWAVAWYADVNCLWLPRSKDDFLKLDTQATDLGTRFSGILITPQSRDKRPSIEVAAEYGDFAALVLDGRVATITGPTPSQPGFSIYDKAGSISEIYRRFPYRTPLLRQEMVYYSEGQLKESSLDE
ncbi:PMT family glycosyltransferase4-amino-4-deoxy-L-arabinose transferase [Haloferula helveola]|uniref:PMT family glycosyltransferase4-amino-4-deoxy-L-arabinose transferase n=1 Tax=Haloferula helveola TaxID=490095 RepID=A0ABN6H4F6_9BACT|nr:PMT family glycosyltransferase4-amino-4-deoxy-L-arabinose transferase [Haloferula helveola]